MKDILTILDEVDLLTPLEFPEDLPTKKELLGNFAWYDFEIKVWELGENIRYLFLQNPKLKKDKDIINKILKVIKTTNLRRGRQSFVLLLGFVGAKSFAPEIALFVDDKDINGHVLDTLLKMKAKGYADKIKSLINSDVTWIRNLAKKYCELYPI